MSRDNLTARFDLRVNPQDPSTWLEPGQTLIGADGRDWAWCYVLYAEVPGFPAYCVGTNGSIWSRWKRDYADLKSEGTAWGLCDRWERLMPATTSHGYLNVTLCGERPGEKRINKTLHAMVAETFWGPRPTRHQCRHLNGIQSDCRFANLAWGTPKQNQADRRRHGTDPRGERGSGAILAGADVLEIRRLYAAGMKKTDIASRFNVTRTNVYFIVTRKTWTEI